VRKADEEARRERPGASICCARSWISRFGESRLAWRITCGSIGRWPNASVGFARPSSIAMIGRPARIPVSYMSTWG
jgi:hypothetical protein